MHRQAKALYAYSAQNEGETNIHDGDVLTVLELGNDGWSTVQGAHGKGLVPTTYIELLPEAQPVVRGGPPAPPPQGQKPGAAGVVVALYEFQDQTGDAQNLSFGEGDRFQLIADDDPDWVQVRDGHGRTGFVPRNYVEIQAAAPAPAPAHTPPPAPSMGKKPSLVQASPPGNQGRGAGVSVPQKAASAPVATNSMRGDTQCIPCNKTTKKSAEKGLCLKKLSTTNSKFNCDKHDPAGREKIKKGTTMYGCRTCDYDVCIKCWKKFGLKSIKISNPQVSRAASESSFANTSLSSFQAAPAPTYDDGPANQATQQLQRQTQAWDTETRQLEAQLADEQRKVTALTERRSRLSMKHVGDLQQQLSDVNSRLQQIEHLANPIS